jgi:elongation factor Ts
MAVTAADVKKLREHTGAGMMDCKRALEAADGDFDKAVELLRIKGAKDVGKRVSRSATNGLVAAYMEGNEHGALIEINCETDFVAKTEGFQSLAADVSAFVALSRPADVAQLLAAQTEAGQTIGQLVDEANVSLGEKIEIRRFERFDNGCVYVYLHKHDPALPPSVGALVELDVPNEELAKNIAQHIAAMSPRFLSREDVPDELVAAERRIAEEIAREEGKPEQAIARIVDGRTNGFFKDVCLLEQSYVRDNKKTVGALLKENNATVTRFARFKVGQA